MNLILVKWAYIQISPKIYFIFLQKISNGSVLILIRCKKSFELNQAHPWAFRKKFTFNQNYLSFESVCPSVFSSTIFLCWVRHRSLLCIRLLETVTYALQWFTMFFLVLVNRCFSSLSQLSNMSNPVFHALDVLVYPGTSGVGNECRNESPFIRSPCKIQILPQC